MITFIAAAAIAFQADRAIVKQVVVPAKPAEVYAAWTTSAGAKTFFAPGAKINLKHGGAYEILFDLSQPLGSQGTEGCQVLSFVPDKMLSFSWNTPPSMPAIRGRRTFVVLDFAPVEGGKTKLELRHAGWGKGEAWDQAYAFFEKAWDQVLGNCVKRFESGPVTWDAPAGAPKAPAAQSDVVKKLAGLVGGVWRGKVGPPNNQLDFEVRYRWTADKRGIIGEGIIGKGTAKPSYLNSQIATDTRTGETYYLDSHNSDVVYYGYVHLEKDDVVFIFGPVGGDMSAFSSRARFTDKDTFVDVIRDAQGREQVALTLKRSKS